LCGRGRFAEHLRAAAHTRALSQRFFYKTVLKAVYKHHYGTGLKANSALSNHSSVGLINPLAAKAIDFSKKYLLTVFLGSRGQLDRPAAEGELDNIPTILLDDEKLKGTILAPPAVLAPSLISNASVTPLAT
jgi:hypothetical protein